VHLGRGADFERLGDDSIPAEAAMMEHRWGERFTVDLPVRLRSGHRLIGAGRLRNLSISGALVQTELRLTALAPIDVEVRVGSSREMLEAFVTRQDEGALGIEWLEVGPAVVALVASFVGALAAPPTAAAASSAA
jgi:hypothetical protein